MYVHNLKPWHVYQRCFIYYLYSNFNGIYTYVFHYLKWLSPSWGMNAGQLEAFFDA
jgi:hypothetical protein